MAEVLEDEVPFARPSAHQGAVSLLTQNGATRGLSAEAGFTEPTVDYVTSDEQNEDKRVAFALTTTAEDSAEMLRKQGAQTGREVMHEILTAIQLHQEHLRAQSRHLREMTTNLERAVKRAVRKTHPHRQGPATVPEETDVDTLSETPEPSFTSSRPGDLWGELRNAIPHSRGYSPGPPAAEVLPVMPTSEAPSPTHSPFHRVETPRWTGAGHKATPVVTARRSSNHSGNTHSEAASTLWSANGTVSFPCGSVSNIVPSVIGASRQTHAVPRHSLRSTSGASGSQAYESHSGVTISGPHHDSPSEPQHYSSHWGSEDFPPDEGLRRQMRQAYLRMQVRLDIRNDQTPVSPARLINAMHRMGFNKYSLEDLAWMLQTMAKKVVECGWLDDTKESTCRGISFKNFVRLMLLIDQPQAAELFKFSRHENQMMLTCREILVAGDINRLVAELAQVRVEELAEPGRADGFSKWIEPIGGIVILANAIVIGVSASGEMDEGAQTGVASWSSWTLWLDALFTMYFCAELVARCHLNGIWNCVHGPERRWNVFDFGLVVMGLLDIALSTLWKSTQEAKVISILRVIRLLRLSRLFRIFRMRQMKELVLMVKGLAAGMRTLCLAILLLLVTIYMIAVVATTLLAEDVPENVDGDMFRTVPIAMFTIFRCLMGDCADAKGRPLVYLYFDSYGVLFVIGYCSAMVFIVFGIFNLIFAIYIESTLVAAKAASKLDHKEHLRVAKIAKELLKKFALGSHLLEKDPNNELADLSTYGRRFSTMMRKSNSSTTDLHTDTDHNGTPKSQFNGLDHSAHGTFQISREVFERVLWHPSVQELLDQLEISQDRAHLFEILDADASGSVEAAELIQGLLHLRGDAKKSDMVANLLAVRAAQTMLRRLEKEHQEVKGIVEAMFTAGMRPVPTSHIDSLSAFTGPELVPEPVYHEIYHDSPQ